MTRITAAKDDGIGPEIMDLTIPVLQDSGAEIDIDHIDVGEKVTWEVIKTKYVYNFNGAAAYSLGQVQ
ncbi:hypothetical protein [Mucilaginibacter flavidus]|uniref:hypothetical protein n=1 Tax=Mucilaginibacter flavidus TaxID=2949309 RepID=UPI0020936CFF|nr:hypothetical protein [Mucilaginibacter flavidus]MCO5947995.1 hypothetical protein [Mucilaginibacter flavidus]